MSGVSDAAALWPQIWAKASEYLAAAGIRIIGAIIILVVGLKLIKLLTRFLNRRKSLDKIDPGARSFIGSFLSIALKIVLFLTVAATLGVPTANLIAIIGSAGLAIGLALQGSLRNVAGGLVILITHPFRVGDLIVTDGNPEAFVQEITVIHTVVLTKDNRRIIIPNGSLADSTVINLSAEPQRRVDVEVNVPYSSDTEQVRAVLLDICAGHELILQDPPPFARIISHGESAVVFVVRAWCLTEHYDIVRCDLLELIKREFDRRGISFPFPQLDVHLDPK
ncbi:MAG: mechanosensitive ion channel [Oscillospiraceae bacterium]|nr:mechanosensitive ion channel [Oscillospiraceae bacterium]